MFEKGAILFCLVFGVLYGFSQQIILDDNFSDWTQVRGIYSDPKDDGRNGGIDFTDIRISNDQDRIFIYFDTQQEINIQSDNSLILYMDLDNNANTGLRINGLGAELVYELGRRSGSFFLGSFNFNIRHQNIGLVSSPTVTSDKFELCLSRRIVLGNTIFNASNQIRVQLVDNNTNGDRAPDFNGGYLYNMDNTIVFENELETLSKESNDLVRVLAYNVLRDNLHDPALFSEYNRILKAIQPDIIGFSEIYNHTSAQTRLLVERILPSELGGQWYHSSVSPDIHLISRYPILRTQRINGNGAFVLDMGEGKNLLVIVTHLPCCENDVGRQQEVDNIMSFLRSVRFGISSLNIPVRTPYIIMGDKNFVGNARQLKTLITGDIFDNTSFGIDYKPDWDNTDLEDAIPMTTGLPMSYTWPGSTSSFSAGRLDYIIYTGSELTLKKSFALQSSSLSSQVLDKYNINISDTDRASDHLPLIGDFSLGREVSTAEELAINKMPFSMRREGTQLIVNSGQSGVFRIIDISGRVVTEKNNIFPKDDIYLDINTFGIYILQFYSNGNVYSLKLWNGD